MKVLFVLGPKAWRLLRAGSPCPSEETVSAAVAELKAFLLTSRSSGVN